jgi:transcriptional regulator with XRE-family HTH domain
MSLARQGKTVSHEKPAKGIGERIKAIRLGRGYSQRLVAERVGVTFQQIHKYEAGQQHLTVERLLAIAEALGVSPTYLLEGATDSAWPTPQNRLREFRERRAMTQVALAEAVNTTRQNIRLYETGISDMTVDWLIRLGRALHCHPWALVDPDPIPTDRSTEAEPEPPTSGRKSA